MNKPNARKLIKALLLFLPASLGFMNEVRAQVIYGVTSWPLESLWAVDVVGCTCDITEIGPLTAHPEGGLALCPDGSLYLSSFGELFSVNPTNGICTSVPGMPIIPYNLNGLVCTGNGILWGVQENTGGRVFKYDLNANTVTLIGIMPPDAPNYNGGMFIYNSSIYIISQDGLVRIDTINPANSVLVFSIPPEINVNGVTLYGDCNMALMYTHSNLEGYNFRLLSLLDGSIIKLCDVSPHFSYMFMSSSHQFSPSGCELLLDLDCDDSSGASEADFNSPTFTCLTPNGVPVADEDVLIFSDEAITEMTIAISPTFIPDGSDEFLDVAGSFSSEINVIGAGSDNISLVNTNGLARIEDFIDALHAIVYVNTADIPTEGQRIVDVQFFVQSGESCDIARAYIEVVNLPFIQIDLGPDVTLCDEELVIFDAGNSGAMYLWSTTATTQMITTGIEGQYIVTVSNGIECPDQDTVLLDILPNIVVSLGPDTYICENEPAEIIITSDASFPISIDLDISPGSAITIADMMGTYTLIDEPSELTSYTITEITPSEPACVSIMDAIQNIDVLPTFYIEVDTTICDGDSVWLGTYWQMNAGVYGSTYDSEAGCDSVVSTTIQVLPQEIISHVIDTCDPTTIGIFQVLLNNPDGCDTIVQTTIRLFPSDTTILTASTCISSETGMQVMTQQGSNGCDSVIITTVSYAPPVDTTFTTQSTCDQFATGVFIDTLSGFKGCDSLVQQTVLFSPPDTTYTFATSCFPADTGISLTTLINTLGCDSLIIHLVSPGTADTTYSFLASCDSADIGIHQQLYVTSLGCDSLHITTVTFSNQDSTFLFTSSCFPSDTGEFQQVLINQFGCDSIVTQLVSLHPGHSATLQSQSCNPADTGEFVTQYINQYGCDSTITMHVSLVPSNDIFIYYSSCHPADTGTFVQHFFNQFGCDSIETSVISLVVADTTILSNKTCEPGQFGMIENTYITDDGCDSLVITETTLFPLPQVSVEVTSDFNGYAISCFGESDGSIIANVSGISPFDFVWSTANTDQSLAGLSAGNYSVTVTDGNGCIIEGGIELFDSPIFSISLVVSQPGCFEVDLGSITVMQKGGAEPIRYSIDGFNYQSENIFSNLPGGMYEITAFDANDCESNEIIRINIPLIVNVELGDDQTILIGDTAILHAIVNIPYDSLASIVWTGLVNPDCPTCLTQPVVPFVTTAYSITVESIDGCKDEDQLTLLVLKDIEVYVPNVFSPNGDNVNDRLLINAGPFVEKISSFSIFDRWGNMVYAENNFLPGDTENAWDGSFNEKMVNPGVFTYRMLVVDHNGNSFVRYGSVTVLR